MRQSEGHNKRLTGGRRVAEFDHFVRFPSNASFNQLDLGSVLIVIIFQCIWIWKVKIIVTMRKFKRTKSWKVGWGKKIICKTCRKIYEKNIKFWAFVHLIIKFKSISSIFPFFFFFFRFCIAFQFLIHWSLNGKLIYKLLK